MTRWYFFEWVFGPLARLLKRIGFGAAVLGVQADGDIHHRGSMITGTVTAQAVLNDRHVDQLTVSVGEMVTQGKSQILRDLQTIVIATNVHLKVDSPTELAFSIEIPEHMRISPQASGGSVSTGARITSRSSSVRVCST